ASPQVAATALWAPVMSWCLLQTLAEAVDGDNIPQTALDLFDRLRLREPLARSFHAMGLEGEEGWRAAARLKILLILQSGAGQTDSAQTTAAEIAPTDKLTQAAAALASEAISVSPATTPAGGSKIPASLWQDPDVRWLTGYNEAEGHAYVIRECYEEFLWWLALPELLKL